MDGKKVMQAQLMESYRLSKWPALSRCDSSEQGWCGELNLRLGSRPRAGADERWSTLSRWRTLPDTYRRVIEWGILQKVEELEGMLR